MNWNVQLPSTDFSVYELVSEDGRKVVCKYNRSQGTIRLRYDGHYGVFMIEKDQLINRKFALSNVYGSEIGTVTKNLWHENTGSIAFNNPFHKLNYKIDAYSSFIEVSEKGANNICEIESIPHPGREQHYFPILIALAWTQLVNAGVKMEIAA